MLDAPCSATGVIRRHPDIKSLRRAEDIAELAATQQALLHNLWPMLAPGSLLLYATCSVLKIENEQQIAAFLAVTADASEHIITADWGIARPHGRQILPGDHNMDGFYYALLRKQGA
ncbi:MAG: rRNA (cytosine967-C5)-methyltransferase [Pseudomonadota bacterium]|nr:rRNA (cytosine967-C5)-methyltransferase [Pseudomonadota bacterium]